MEFKDIDALIDDMIDYIYQNKTVHTHDFEIWIKRYDNHDATVKAVEKAKKEGLIKELLNQYQLDTRGIDIKHAGGWLKYLEKINESDWLTISNLKREVRLKGWQINTFWPLFAISIIGGLSGIIALSGQLGVIKLPILQEKQVKTIKDTISTVRMGHEKDSSIRSK